MVAIFRRPADGQAGGGDKALKPAEREGAFEEGGCVEETLRRPGRAGRAAGAHALRWTPAATSTFAA